MDNGKTMAQWHDELTKAFVQDVQQFAKECEAFKGKTKIRRDMTNETLVPKIEAYGKALCLAMTQASDIDQKKLVQMFSSNRADMEFEKRFPLPESFFKKLTASSILPGDTYYEKEQLPCYIAVLIRNGRYNAQKEYLREHSISLTHEEMTKYQSLKSFCGQNLHEYLVEASKKDTTGFIQKLMSYRDIHESTDVPFEAIFKDFHVLRQEAKNFLNQQFIMKDVKDPCSPEAREAYEQGMKIISFQLADMVLREDTSEHFEKTRQLKEMLSKVFAEVQAGKETISPEIKI